MNAHWYIFLVNMVIDRNRSFSFEETFKTNIVSSSKRTEKLGLLLFFFFYKMIYTMNENLK